MASSSIISLSNVRKAFGHVVAVDGLSLEIEQGEVFGLLGPNGAGKSTTMGMIMGMLLPDAGQVQVAGGDPAAGEVRQQIGFAPQALALYDELTARENLEFFGTLYGLHRRERRQRAQELLAMIGLSDRAEDRVKGFSGGMKRRVNLAVALMHRPALVLLDEPTAGVDPQSRNAIFEIVRTLNTQGCTIVYITHYMEEVQQLCKRAGIIDHGRLLALGTVEGLIRDHGGQCIIHAERACGAERHMTDEPLPVLSRILAQEGVKAIRIDRPDLASVFLNLTGRELRD